MKRSRPTAKQIASGAERPICYFESDLTDFTTSYVAYSGSCQSCKKFGDALLERNGTEREMQRRLNLRVWADCRRKQIRDAMAEVQANSQG